MQHQNKIQKKKKIRFRRHKNSTLDKSTIAINKMGHRKNKKSKLVKKELKMI
jgi:hypothetical protein